MEREESSHMTDRSFLNFLLLSAHTLAQVNMAVRSRGQSQKQRDDFPHATFVVLEKGLPWDLPVSPVSKTLPSNAGGASSIPGWGVKISHALQAKTKT